jgi:glycosyltransferase involved in cell wall biosynthesis
MPQPDAPPEVSLHDAPSPDAAPQELAWARRPSVAVPVPDREPARTPEAAAPLAPAAPPDLPSRLARALLAVQEQHAEVARLRAELVALRGSRSWRLTKPLRGLRARLGRIAPGPPALAPPAPASAAAAAVDASLQVDASAELVRRAGLPASLATARLPSLFVDVTELALNDPGGGVQRVVRRLLAEWLVEPPAGLRVTPVRLASDGRYVHARVFLAALLGAAPGEVGQDAAIAPRAGDLFLGLDLVRDRAALAAPAWRALRAQGVLVSVVVYDLLPRQHPEWFPAGTAERFGEWLEAVLSDADQALCISRVVADDLRATCAGRAGHQPAIASFALDAGLDAWLLPVRRLPPHAPGQPRFLVVGTLEPRKGHAQALAAFEALWARGSQAQLLVAGRDGWGTDALVARLRAHPERGRRLRWIEDADDADLLAAYHDSTALLACSLGEGVGLPLVEAAAHGLPVLARDLPVFREVGDPGVTYFQGETPAALVAALEDWIARWTRGAIPAPVPAACHRWRDSAEALLLALRATRSPPAPAGDEPPR